MALNAHEDNRQHIWLCERSGQNELFITLLKRAGFRLEQIISHGQSIDQEFWYDQNEDEWVVLLRGKAVLKFKRESLSLKTGDYLLIPANAGH